MKHMIAWPKTLHGIGGGLRKARKSESCPCLNNGRSRNPVKVLEPLVRVGEYGGFLLVETNDPAAIHKMTSTYPAFQFRVDQVLEVQDAVAAELEAIAWRDGLRTDGS